MKTNTTGGLGRWFGGLALGAALAVAGCTADLHTPDASKPDERMAEATRLVNEGRQAQESGDLPRAEEFYRRSLELNPNSAVAWNNLGTVLMQKGPPLDAAAALKRAAELNPDPYDARPFENLGLLYYNSGYGEQSLQYYEMALERNPNWLPALRGTALSARKLNKSDEKLADAMRRGLLLETDPKWRDIFERERLRIEGVLRDREKARSGN